MKRLAQFVLALCALTFLTGATIVIRGPVAVAVAYDSDAQAYFDQIATAGSTISTSHKNAINAFVVGCKEDSIWALLLDVGPLMGDDYIASFVKLKKLSSGWSYTNNNFISGDYNPSVGLTGNGSSKWLDPGVNGSDLTSNSTGLGIYDASTAGGTPSVAGRYTSDTSFFAVYSTAVDDKPYSFQYNVANSLAGGSAITGTIGFVYATQPSSGSHVLYRNGSSVASSGTVGGTLPSGALAFFCLQESGVTRSDFTAHTLGFLCLTSGMDGTQAAALNTRVATLQAAR